MANKFHNTQAAPSKEQGKSENRKGKERTDARPGYKQVACSKPSQKPLGKGFKSKTEMVDKL